MTSMNAMAAIRAKLLEQQEGRNGANRRQSGGDNASYQFWNMPDGTNATIRFLPDGDPNNQFFWVERKVINLPFAGVVGEDTERPVTVTVPCMEMFGKPCHVKSVIAPLWQDEATKPIARQYYRKLSYLFQGFVVNSPFEEDELPENPIRRFMINQSIYSIIHDSLMNPDMEDMPTDYVAGRDFRIAKSKNGQYASYNNSNWVFKTRSLSEAELGAIDQYGLFDLKEFLGKEPDADGVAMLKAMFEDSYAGNPFDVAAYGQHYRAYGVRGGAPASRAPAQVRSNETYSAPPAPPAAPAAPAAEAPASSAANMSASSILAQLKSIKNG